MLHVSPPQIKADAERALRRGELKDALLLFQQLHKITPSDHTLQSRIQAIESVLEPESKFSAEPAIKNRQASRPPTQEQTAEMLFDQGDFSAAIATYSRIVQSRQGHQLAQERLQEIKTIQTLQPETIPAPRTSHPGNVYEFLEMLLMRIAGRRKF